MKKTTRTKVKKKVKQNVKDGLRKAFLLGMGITLLTKDRVEKEVKSFAKDYKLNDTEAKRLARKVLADAGKHRKTIEAKIRKTEKILRKTAKELKKI